MLTGPLTRPVEAQRFAMGTKYPTMISLYIEGRRNLWIEW